jgi:hypothetical protein
MSALRDLRLLEIDKVTTIVLAYNYGRTLPKKQ